MLTHKASVAGVIAGMLFVGTTLASGFEDGMPEGWVCDGECGTSGADGDITLSPTGSSAYGWVASRIDSPLGLGLPGVGGAGSPNTGSRLRSTVFSASAGDDLEFYFNYVTSDGGGFADYAWARLLDDSLNQVALLFTARTTPGGNTVPGFGMPGIEATITPSQVNIIANATDWSPLGPNSDACYAVGCGNTGWVLSNYSVPVSGDFVLEFGVVNWNDNSYQSGLAFDGITVGGAPITPPPPPAAVAVPAVGLYGLLAMGGLLGLVGALRSRRRVS